MVVYGLALTMLSIQTARDCQEVMRVGGGLDNGRRMRRGNLDIWRYIFQEESASKRAAPPPVVPISKKLEKLKEADDNAGLWRRDELEAPLTNIPLPVPAKPFADLPEPCDPDYPRIFHMFWAGKFTDKPYSALLSFLFTQNLGLHLETPDPAVCRPQFWVWINPGAAAAVPNPNALRDMYDGLKENVWAAPFMHPRFKDVIKFKMWNTTEQMDSIPELKEDWRALEESLFNSGGVKYKVPGGKKAKETTVTTSTSEAATNNSLADTVSSLARDELIKQEKDKDNNPVSETANSNLSTILSDLVRFIVTHRFGGIYLDADTLFLRDWEELWGWKGAFAYRWSRHEAYNTAVLRLNKGSVLGKFLIRTALRNELDFHPMTIQRYIKDAYLDGLLLRLPCAMFDPVWLSQEGYQKERPTWPLFHE